MFDKSVRFCKYCYWYLFWKTLWLPSFLQDMHFKFCTVLLFLWCLLQDISFKHTTVITLVEAQLLCRVSLVVVFHKRALHDGDGV